MALAVATPTRSPLNRPGPDVDGDGADLVELDPGLAAHELDGRGRGSRRGAGPGRRGTRPARPRGRRWRSPPGRWPSRCRGSACGSAPRSRRRGPAARPPGGGPRPRAATTGRRDRERQHALVVGLARRPAAPPGSRRAGPGATTSPHSMSVTAALVEQLGDARGRPAPACGRGGRRRGGASGSRPVVGADQDEGRAGDRLGDAQAPGEALDERGLARAQVAGQQDEVAGRGQAAPARRPGPGSRRRTWSGADHDRIDDRARAGRRPLRRRRYCLARTRSARIWATVSPPPRSTAAGWKVGTRTPRRNG